MTGTKERPILFSGPMVRSILDGRKTQTRRVVKGAAGAASIYAGERDGVWAVERFGDAAHAAIRCPYGVPGDRRETSRGEADGRRALASGLGAATRSMQPATCCPSARHVAEQHSGDRGEGSFLWVRETYAFEREYDHLRPSLVPHTSRVAYAADGPLPQWASKWRPSIHMPRWASRITLEITDVRVERVRDISEDDAIAEGVQDWCVEADPRTGEPIQVRLLPSEEFAKLWDSINATRGFGWDANPWVWVVEFKRINR